jgi:hypothetical protein
VSATFAALRPHAGSSLAERASTMRGIYYLLLRCLPEREFFREEPEYASFRERLVEQLNQNRGDLLDYCLTRSEIRLIVHLRATQPGRFVQEHFSSWLRTLNQRYGRYGHVLAERVRIRVIESPQELRRITCFLARYPVDEGLAASPTAYRHSAHRAHLGIEPAAGLGVRLMLSYFGESLPEAREQLRRAVRRFEVSQQEYDQLRRLPPRRHRGAGVQAMHQQASALVGVNENEVYGHIIAAVERELCKRHRLPTTALFVTPTPPGVAVVRSVIVHVLTQANVMRIATLARRYKRAPQTLKGEMQRHRSDPALASFFYVDLEELLGHNVWEGVPLSSQQMLDRERLG